ncbi:MAG TPA: hypothetical protein VGJ84_18155, partial [Polyangiaceae bacterium]
MTEPKKVPPEVRSKPDIAQAGLVTDEPKARRGLYSPVTRWLERLGRVVVVFAVFGVATYFALEFGTGSLWRGLEVAQ